MDAQTTQLAGGGAAPKAAHNLPVGNQSASALRQDAPKRMFSLRQSHLAPCHNDPPLRKVDEQRPPPYLFWLARLSLGAGDVVTRIGRGRGGNQRDRKGFVIGARRIEKGASVPFRGGLCGRVSTAVPARQFHKPVSRGSEHHSSSRRRCPPVAQSTCRPRLRRSNV